MVPVKVARHKKNSHTYCKNLLVIKTKYYAHAPRGIDWQEKTIAHPRPPLIRKTIKKISHAPTLLHNGSPYVHATGITNFNTSISQIHNYSTSMTLISLPPYLRTIIKYQIDHSIQFTFYDSFYYTQLGCPSFQDQFYNHRKYHAVLKDSQII